MARTKIGLSVPEQTTADLSALAFILKTPKGEIVERGVALVAASLSDDERRAFESARRAQRAT